MIFIDRDDLRSTLEVTIECYAPEELFESDWEDLSESAKEYYEHHHLPCEGTGSMNLYCEDCPFSDVYQD